MTRSLLMALTGRPTTVGPLGLIPVESLGFTNRSLRKAVPPGFGAEGGGLFSRGSVILEDSTV